MSNARKIRIDRVKVERWVSHNCPFCAFVYRFFKYRIFIPLRRVFVRCFTKTEISHVDPYAVYWISPQTLKYMVGGLEKGNKRISQNMCGELKGGNWDKEARSIDGLAILEAAKNRFIDGEEWENTEYYKICMEKINKNHVWRNCKNKEDLDRYLVEFDNLYEKIKRLLT